MAIGNLEHTGFISYCRYDNLQSFYTTTQSNEIIEFKENGIQRQLNSLIIESELTDLYVRILPSDYILFVPANDVRTYNLTKIEKIQVMGNSAQKLRWSGCYY